MRYVITESKRYLVDIQNNDELYFDLVKEDLDLELSIKIDPSFKGDVKIVVNHLQANCHSDILIKTFSLDHDSEIIGDIIINKQADASNAKLCMRALALTDNKIELLPYLHINNPNVKCSHSASITNFNEHEIAYLTAKGISEPQAKDLIRDGFMADLDLDSLRKTSRLNLRQPGIKIELLKV